MEPCGIPKPYGGRSWLPHHPKIRRTANRHNTNGDRCSGTSNESVVQEFEEQDREAPLSILNGPISYTTERRRKDHAQATDRA